MHSKRCPVPGLLLLFLLLARGRGEGVEQCVEVVARTVYDARCTMMTWEESS